MRQLKRLLKVPTESFFLFDTGVFQALRSRGPLDRPEDIHGASVEGLVVQHLKAWIDDQQASYELSFWLARGGSEVDFVLYGKYCFIEQNFFSLSRLKTLGSR